MPEETFSPATEPSNTTFSFRDILESPEGELGEVGKTNVQEGALRSASQEIADSPQGDGADPFLRTFDLLLADPLDGEVAMVEVGQELSRLIGDGQRARVGASLNHVLAYVLEASLLVEMRQ